MNFRRIASTAVIAALVPLLVGFVVTLVTSGADGLRLVRLGIVAVLLVLVFVRFGRTQRERTVAHGAAAVAVGWILAEAVRAASLSFFGWFATRASTPEVPAWSPDLPFLATLAATAAIGIGLARARRGPQGGSSPS